MKQASLGMAAHLDGGRTTLADAFKVTRADGYVLAVTSHDVDDVIDGVVYSASPGLDVTDFVTAVGTSVGTLELTTLNDGSVFSTVEVLNGLWRNAAFELFRYNWADIPDGKLPIVSGRLGETTLRDKTVVIELRDMRQYLLQKVGAASSKTCRYRLGDNRCRVDLHSSSSPYTVSGTLTSVNDNRIFRDSSRAEPADWFGEGMLEFITGNNAGATAKVRSYAADGTFTLALPVFSEVQVGDQYLAVVGCRKRLDADCVAKFGNALNFGGEPHRKGMNGVVQIP